MKHLEKFEEFSYHSDMFEGSKKKKGNKREIENYKCLKCKSQIKPIYQPTLKPIERLM
jgi:hypothetical protein